MNNVEGIQITNFPVEGYEPLVDYKSWRVAVLKYCEDVLPDHIKTMQKHMETDEVFVLVSGNCTLIEAGADECPGELKFVKLEPNKVYNVKRGVWHNHVLDEEGAVVIVENQDTTDDNSPILPISAEQMQQIQEHFA